MMLIVIIHVCMIYFTEISSQNLELYELHLQTPCTEGLRHGIDTFYMNATIKDDFPGLVVSGWDADVAAEVWVNGNVDFLDMCVIDIGMNGEFCGQSSPGKCYCRSINNETGNVELVISHIAAVNITEGIIRLRWEHSNGNVLYSSNNRTLPRIYDVHGAVLQMKVNGNQVPMTADCNYIVVPNAYNQIELCCSNTATPCFPRVIIKQYKVGGNVSKCVRYRFMMNHEQFRSTMIKSYAVCSKDIYYQFGACLAQSQAKETDQVNIIVIIIFAIPIGIIVYASGRMAYVMFIKKRRLQAEGSNAADSAAQFYG